MRARFQQEIDKRLRAQSIDTPTVRQVKNAQDAEGVRGLSDEVADFEVLCYALVSHRELTRDGRPVSDVKLGKLGADWELVKTPLPSMTAWSDAVERGGHPVRHRRESRAQRQQPADLLGKADPGGAKDRASQGQ